MSGVQGSIPVAALSISFFFEKNSQVLTSISSLASGCLELLQEPKEMMFSCTTQSLTVSIG
ncbi:hypothetical protein D3C81_1940940 [compost metagenome]